MATANYNLTTVDGTDPVQDGDDAITALANDLDAIIATADGGTLAARPVSSGGSPGIRGRIYRASDDGVLYYDRGTGWDAVGATLPASGVTLGADVNLYRQAADVLATDDDLHVRHGQASEVRAGYTLLGLPGVTLGGDTYLYRSGANALGTAGSFAAGGGATAVQLDASGPGSTARVLLGGDTYFYRKAASQFGTAADLEFTSSTRGPILKSTGGGRFRIGVDDAANLFVTTL